MYVDMNVYYLLERSDDREKSLSLETENLRREMEEKLSEAEKKLEFSVERIRRESDLSLSAAMEKNSKLSKELVHLQVCMYVWVSVRVCFFQLQSTHSLFCRRNLKPGIHKLFRSKSR